MSWGEGKEKSKTTLYGGISFGPITNSYLHSAPQQEEYVKFDQLLLLISKNATRQSLVQLLDIYIYDLLKT